MCVADQYQKLNYVYIFDLIDQQFTTDVDYTLTSTTATINTTTTTTSASSVSNVSVASSM